MLSRPTDNDISRERPQTLTEPRSDDRSDGTYSRTLRQLRSHPAELTLLAFGLAGGAAFGIAAAYGFHAFDDAWTHLHIGWIWLAAGAALLSIPAYALAYTMVARAEDGPRLHWCPQTMKSWPATTRCFRSPPPNDDRQRPTQAV